MTDGIFPETKRVVFKKAPLTQVVCQVRFPSILKISAEDPAAFQEDVRSVFPDYSSTPGFGGQALPPMVASLMNLPLGHVMHNFKRMDGSSNLTLQVDSLTLATERYTQWGDFSSQMLLGIEALHKNYAPHAFSRVGLRFTNEINRNSLGLSETRWAELLNSNLLGELSDPLWEEAALICRRTIQMPLGEGYSFILNHGFDGNVKPEKSYYIDFDFFNDQLLEVHNATDTINCLHRYVGNAFRWCIKPTLRDSLEPDGELDSPAGLT